MSRVEINKVTLPNMDGQSIGGTINIVTPTGFDYKGAYLNVERRSRLQRFRQGQPDLFRQPRGVPTKFFDDKLAVFASGEYWFKQYTSQSFRPRRR